MGSSGPSGSVRSRLRWTFDEEDTMRPLTSIARSVEHGRVLCPIEARTIDANGCSACPAFAGQPGGAADTGWDFRCSLTLPDLLRGALVR